MVIDACHVAAMLDDVVAFVNFTPIFVGLDKLSDTVGGNFPAADMRYAAKSKSP